MKYYIVLIVSVGINCTTLITDNLYVSSDPTPKEEAFEILKNKCNVCHVKENPSKVFTIDNMDRYNKRIKRQVFLFKRMPKGNKIKLSKEEKETLKHWIKTVKNNKK